MTNPDLENLLSNLLKETEKFPKGGDILIQGGQLLIFPESRANLYRDLIIKFKPEILIYFGHCPVCTGELESRIEKLEWVGMEKLAIHRFCPAVVGHYDKWER